MNLVEGISDPNSPYFQKIHVKGDCFNFCHDTINTYVQRLLYENVRNSSSLKSVVELNGGLYVIGLRMVS